MVADRAGSIFLKWNLEVIMEMEEKLTGIQRSASVPYGGMCMYGWGGHTSKAMVTAGGGGQQHPATQPRRQSREWTEVGGK